MVGGIYTQVIQDEKRLGDVIIKLSSIGGVYVSKYNERGYRYNHREIRFGLYSLGDKGVYFNG